MSNVIVSTNPAPRLERRAKSLISYILRKEIFSIQEIDFKDPIVKFFTLEEVSDAIEFCSKRLRKKKNVELLLKEKTEASLGYSKEENWIPLSEYNQKVFYYNQLSSQSHILTNHFSVYSALSYQLGGVIYLFINDCVNKTPIGYFTMIMGNYSFKKVIDKQNKLPEKMNIFGSLGNKISEISSMPTVNVIEESLECNLLRKLQSYL